MGTLQILIEGILEQPCMEFVWGQVAVTFWYLFTSLCFHCMLHYVFCGMKLFLVLFVGDNSNLDGRLKYSSCLLGCSVTSYE